ncbi:type II secretion system protein GspC [Pseudoalteromonas sp. MMG010]|uniref:type II secretion system protein GspC n=1 Tax=Pseudoalteromonas sp. MMG010 TaxID=2822685 RepID=UPI001B39DEB1|nr:type II secretion system protein GspC [Pseudoalteromonas sp. MMG010]MBQ4834171.1 type II secretion system protein GspC [Pseudoalteromonas sp. MMG010]
MEPQIQQLKQFLTRLPHAKLSALVMMLVVVYIAFLLSKLVWLTWPMPSFTPLKPLHANKNNTVSENRMAQNIVDQYLFGKAQTVKGAKAVQTKVINDAPETRLRINLTGIVAVSDDDKAGVAIIESQGKQVTYLIDEVVKGTRAKLVQILPDRVILSTSGRFETLMLDGIDFTKTVSMPVLAKNNNTEKDMQINATADASVKKELMQTREELLKEPGKLFDYIRVSQQMDNGELVGYRLSPGKEPALFKKMGLKNNDLAVSINGYQLNDLKQAMQAFNELRNSSDAIITIERDGAPIDVQFSLQ